MRKLKDLLENFKSRKEAIDYLIKETKLSKSECETAYDFVINLNLDKTIH
ncbi:MAG: hypothetical protein K2J20_00320 [Bacilli bacterium]|nr:hypothetical protein [Bacilli bacterium]